VKSSDKNHFEQAISPKAKQVGPAQGGLKIKPDKTMTLCSVSPKGYLSPRRAKH